MAMLETAVNATGLKTIFCTWGEFRANATRSEAPSYVTAAAQVPIETAL